MVRYRVYDKSHELLGLVYGRNPDEAIREARSLEMTEADYVIPVNNPFELYLLPAEKDRLRLH